MEKLCELNERITRLESVPTRTYNNCHIFESGSVNIEHVEHYHQSNAHVPSQTSALTTEKAKILLAKAQSAGWLNANNHLLCSKTMAALLASRIAAKLRISPRWKPFEELWNIPNLSKYYSAALEQVKTNSRLDEIDKALK